MGFVLYLQAALTVVLIIVSILTLARMRVANTDMHELRAALGKQRPASDRQGAAQAIRLAAVEAAFGSLRDALAESGRLTIAQRIIIQWDVLCAISEARGKPAEHCAEQKCFDGESGSDLCACPCGPCQRAMGLLHRAERDVRSGRA